MPRANRHLPPGYVCQCHKMEFLFKFPANGSRELRWIKTSWEGAHPVTQNNGINGTTSRYPKVSQYYIWFENLEFLVLKYSIIRSQEFYSVEGQRFESDNKCNGAPCG